MSILGLVALIMMLLVLVIFTGFPLLRREQSSTQAFSNKQRERALAYYERVLTNIRDLDDDLATEKIHQNEYEIERERWMERGVALLKMLDELDNAHLIVDKDTANDAEIDAAIEDAISAKQAQKQATGVT